MPPLIDGVLRRKQHLQGSTAGALAGASRGLAARHVHRRGDPQLPCFAELASYMLLSDHQYQLWSALSPSRSLNFLHGQVTKQSANRGAHNSFSHPKSYSLALRRLPAMAEGLEEIKNTAKEPVRLEPDHLILLVRGEKTAAHCMICAFGMYILGLTLFLHTGKWLVWTYG